MDKRPNTYQGSYTGSHTLYGVDITDIVLSDFLLSDHSPILFTVFLMDLSHALGNFNSPTAPLSYGLSQGSILAPSSLYMLHSVLRKHSVSFHFYADDMTLKSICHSKDILL